MDDVDEESDKIWGGIPEAMFSSTVIGAVSESILPIRHRIIHWSLEVHGSAQTILMYGIIRSSSILD